MISELSGSNKVVGAKQVRRALESGTARTVFLAFDAAPNVTEPIAALCGEKGVPTVSGCSMKELGKACNIAVGAAVAAVLAG